MTKRVALLIPSLRGGGAERVVINLAAEIAKREGYFVDIVTLRAGGDLLGAVPGPVNLVQLGKSRALFSLPSLLRYLRRAKPDLAISSLRTMNILAVAARALSGQGTELVVVEHNNFAEVIAHSGPKEKLLLPLMRMSYPKATRIACVSAEGANALARYLKVDRGRVETIYNPVVTDALGAGMAEPLDHPWFAADRALPVVVAAGRLTPQKDFGTLLQAFRRLCETRPANLVILGEGEERERLQRLADELGIGAHVELAGFTAAPLPYFRAADLFVLSSRYEGLPTVLIEALACGTPIVSTDCPSGPREIVETAGIGDLVPVGDAEALALAIDRRLADKGSGMAAELTVFTAEYAASQYLGTATEAP